MAIIVNLLLLIDGLIYDLIGSLFEIFDFLSKVNLFSNDVYSNIVRRIYVVLGLIMMFALAYSLLKAVINPDEFSKGETSFPKLIKNVVVSLAIIAVLPTVFTVAFNIQNSLLNENTIPKIVLGNEYKSTYLNGGKTIAYNSFMAFLHVNESYCKEEYPAGDGYDINECEKSIPTNASNVKWYTLWRLAADKRTFADVKQNVSMGDSIADFNQFGEAVVEGKLSYIMIISTIFGIFLLVVIANFCFDMALRIIKLMFFQIIAPIPVVCRVIPGGKMKDVFPTWIKKTTSTFLDVFIRIFVMYLGIFIILTVTDNWDGIPKGNLSGTQSLVAKALIIMGVVMFIRQAPKLLGDLFHLDTGSMKLGLMDKLAAGGALTAGAVAGGAFGTLGRNAVSTARNVIGAKGKSNKIKALASGVGSMAAGTVSGAARGLWAGKGAKNLKDMKASANTAVAAASAAKEKREAYKAAHKGHNAFSTAVNVGFGHISDTAKSIGGYFGINSLEYLKKDNEKIDDINSKKKALRTAAEDLILGESRKQGVSKDFGLTTHATINGQSIAFDTAILRSMRQKMEIAQAAGASNAGDLQNDYDAYLKQFTDAVQNQALLGKSSFDTLLSGLSAGTARTLEADLGEVRSAASGLRASLKDNLAADYVGGIGFTAEMLDEDKDLTLKTSAMDALGDTLKIAKQKNTELINNIVKKEQSKNGKSS